MLVPSWNPDRGSAQADGAGRRMEGQMNAHLSRRAMTAFTIGGIMTIGGLSRAMQHAAPLPGGAGHALAAAANAAPTTTAAAFRNEMRRLWEDHITWTRLYIVSAAADLPDLDLTTQRLLRNQADIGAAVKPFYGEDAGDELTRLLEEHILGAADLLAAAKSGNQTAIDMAAANWYVNADAIGAFLSAANPERWPLADLQTGMRAHLDLTLQEATARLDGDYAADIAAYDEVHHHILAFADLLSDGIVGQFPDRFAA